MKRLIVLVVSLLCVYSAGALTTPSVSLWQRASGVFTNKTASTVRLITPLDSVLLLPGKFLLAADTFETRSVGTACIFYWPGGTVGQVPMWQSDGTVRPQTPPGASGGTGDTIEVFVDETTYYGNINDLIRFKPGANIGITRQDSGTYDVLVWGLTGVVDTAAGAARATTDANGTNIATALAGRMTVAGDTIAGPYIWDLDGLLAVDSVHAARFGNNGTINVTPGWWSGSAWFYGSWLFQHVAGPTARARLTAPANGAIVADSGFFPVEVTVRDTSIVDLIAEHGGGGGVFTASDSGGFFVVGPDTGIHIQADGDSVRVTTDKLAYAFDKPIVIGAEGLSYLGSLLVVSHIWLDAAGSSPVTAALIDSIRANQFGPAAGGAIDWGDIWSHFSLTYFDTTNVGGDTTIVIRDGGIPLVKLASNSVNSSKIVDRSVWPTDILENSLTASELANLSVGTAELGTAVVTTAKVNTSDLQTNWLDARYIQDGDSLSWLRFSYGISTSALFSYSADNTLLLGQSTDTVKIPVNWYIGSVKIATTPTEFNFVSGVTSAIQLQLDAKETALTDKASLTSTISDVSDFAEADGDSYSGAHDYSAATLEIPNGADPDVTVAGQVSWNTDDFSLRVHDGTQQRAIPSVTFKTFNVWSPNSIADTVCILTVPSIAAPEGIVIVDLELQLWDTLGTYAVSFVERSGRQVPTIAGYIDTLTVNNDSSWVHSTAFYDSIIVAGNSIYMIVPATTGHDQLVGSISYYVKEGD